MKKNKQIKTLPNVLKKKDQIDNLNDLLYKSKTCCIYVVLILPTILLSYYHIIFKS